MASPAQDASSGCSRLESGAVGGTVPPVEKFGNCSQDKSRGLACASAGPQFPKGQLRPSVPSAGTPTHHREVGCGFGMTPGHKVPL